MAVNAPASQIPLFQDASAKTGIPLPVVEAQVNAESSFNPRAVSPTGAQGEFQFEPGTFKAQGVAGSPFNPAIEEKAYVKLMSSLLNQYHGNVRSALAAYNAGPGNIGAGLGYADKILGDAGQGSGLSSKPARTTVAQVPGVSPLTPVSVSGGGVDMKAMAQAVLAKEAARPISDKISKADPLTDDIDAMKSGLYDQPTTTVVGQQAISAAAVNTANAADAPHSSQVLLNMLHQVLGGTYNQQNHADVDESAAQVKAEGTDCSGLISWLMGPQGLKLWNTSYATPSIESAPGIQPGRGKTVTIYNNKQPGNAGHVFIQVGSQFFASEGGAGIRQISNAEAQNYIAHGSDGGTYDAVHPAGL